MDYMGRGGMDTIFATVCFFPMSGSAKTKRVALVKNYRAHNSWRSHSHALKLNRKEGEKRKFYYSNYMHKELKLSFYDLISGSHTADIRAGKQNFIS